MRLRPTRRLGAIRDIESKPFDYLLAVFFNEDLELNEIWKVPCDVCEQSHASNSEMQLRRVKPRLELGESGYGALANFPVSVDHSDSLARACGSICAR